LQEFRPLQEFLVDLQEDCPLQELTPVHFTFASSALAVETVKVANSSAAAVAIATPPALVAFFIALSLEMDSYQIIKTGVMADVLQQNTARRIRL
jgi:hypothetical protein